MAENEILQEIKLCVPQFAQSAVVLPLLARGMEVISQKSRGIEVISQKSRGIEVIFPKDNQGFFFHRSATAYPTIWRAFLDGVL
jgi:hypothetical protein